MTDEIQKLKRKYMNESEYKNKRGNTKNGKTKIKCIQTIRK